MYNWLDDLNNIYRKLDDYNEITIKNEIFEAQLSGGSGWEIFLLVTEKLINIKENNINIYEGLENEITNILNYGYENGFLNK